MYIAKSLYDKFAKKIYHFMLEEIQYSATFVYFRKVTIFNFK